MECGIGTPASCVHFRTYRGYFAISRPTEVSLRLRLSPLHTLTLIDAMCTKPTMVRNTMFPRIASGSPIRKLCLLRSILTVLKDDLDRLQARMEVEEEIKFT
jgi:hypothetical protein